MNMAKKLRSYIINPVTVTAVPRDTALAWELYGDELVVLCLIYCY